MQTVATTAPAWWSIGLQILSALVSIFAIISFVRTGTKTKVEQAEVMQELAHSIKVIADAQQRTDDKVGDAVEMANKEHEAIWKRVDELKDKQTKLCALHTVNHPGQAF